MFEIYVERGPRCGARLELPEGPCVIGRDDPSDIPLRDEKASRRHAEIRAGDEGVRVRDLGSRNGTFLGPERVTDAVARPGDRIRIGDSVLYVFRGEEEPFLGKTIEGHHFTRGVYRDDCAIYYQGEDKRMDRPVLLVVPRKPFLDDPACVDLLRGITRSLASRPPPGFLRVFHLMEESRGIFVATEWPSGPLLARQRFDEHDMKIRLDLVRQYFSACRAAETCPRLGVLGAPLRFHVSPEGTLQIPSADPLTIWEDSTGGRFLSPERVPFIPPEIAAGGAAAETPSNLRSAQVYTAGAVAFYLLSGAPPFRGTDPQHVLRAHIEAPIPDLQAIDPEIPLAAGRVVERCLAKSPSGRYPDMGTLLSAWQKLPGPARTAPKPVRPPPRKPVPGPVLFLLFLLLEVAVFFGARFLARSASAWLDSAGT